MSGIAYEPSHLPERFGLFLIIALGESLAETGKVAGEEPATVSRLAAVAVAFALTCALWWVYFVFAADAIRFAVRTADVAMEVIRPVLPYGHLGFIAGIIAIAAATGEVIMHPLEHLHTRRRSAAVRRYRALPGHVRLHPVADVPHRLHHPAECRRLVPGAFCRWPGRPRRSLRCRCSPCCWWPSTGGRRGPCHGPNCSATAPKTSL